MFSMWPPIASALQSFICMNSDAGVMMRLEAVNSLMTVTSRGFSSSDQVPKHLSAQAAICTRLAARLGSMRDVSNIAVIWITRPLTWYYQYSDVLSSDDIHVQCIVMVHIKCVYGTKLAANSVKLSNWQGRCSPDVLGACCGCVQCVLPALVLINTKLCLPVHAGS